MTNFFLTALMWWSYPFMFFAGLVIAMAATDPEDKLIILLTGIGVTVFLSFLSAAIGSVFV